MSAPLSRLPTGSASVPAAARCIIFINGGRAGRPFGRYKSASFHADAKVPPGEARRARHKNRSSEDVMRKPALLPVAAIAV